MKNSSCEQIWESSLWVPKHCPLPAIVSFTAVGMLKNYGRLGRRGKKITVTFQIFGWKPDTLLWAEIQHCNCGHEREIQKRLGFIFKSVLNSKFLSQNVKPLLACWGPACPFSLSWPWPGLSRSFPPAVINRDHLVYFSFSFFQLFPLHFRCLRNLRQLRWKDRGVGFLSQDVYLPGSNPIAAPTSLGSF